jgi:RNA recognition motif-containing protein
VPYDVLNEEVEALVKEFAPISDCIVPRDPKGYTHGYAFIYLKNKEDMGKVIEMADRRHIRGREVRVRKALKSEGKK